MATIKISELPNVPAQQNGTEVIPIVQSATTYQTPVSSLGFIASGSGADARTMQSKLRDTVSVIDFGADPTGVTDSTTPFLEAIAAAANVYVPNGKYRIDGTVTLTSGTTLYGECSTGQYFGGFTMKDGARLFKDSASSAGPIIVMGWCAAIRGLHLIHDKANGATNGIIQFPSNTIITYSTIQDCQLFGHLTGDVAGTTTSYGIKFEQADLSNVNYFNRISNVHITNCDICVYLGNQANANVFTNVQTRESHIHYKLDGGVGECIENVFTGIGLFSISGSLSPDPIGFNLNEAKNNVFIGYTTEMYGKEFEDGSGNSGNIFLGQANEAVASYTLSGSNLRYTPTVNPYNNEAMYYTTRATGDRFIIGNGASYREIFQISGTLPELNDNTGTLTASDADSRVLFRFPTKFSKSNKRSFIAKLKIFAYGPFDTGMTLCDVDFMYRVTNSSTNAGELAVVRTEKRGNYVSGLYFLTGVAASAAPGVALVGGNYGAHKFDSIRCEIEWTVMDYGSFADFFSTYTGLSSTTAAAATANDVTDAIDLLTVANTAV